LEKPDLRHGVSITKILQASLPTLLNPVQRR
jgi:hypothetical protein